jgi:hypothetical protein
MILGGTFKSPEGSGMEAFRRNTGHGIAETSNFNLMATMNNVYKAEMSGDKMSEHSSNSLSAGAALVSGSLPLSFIS